MLGGDDPTPWNLLHDGALVRLERDARGEVLAWLDAGYLRSRFAEPGALFCLRLRGCTRFEYTPYDEEPLEEFGAIVARKPGLVEALHERGHILVWCDDGLLSLRYESLAIELDSGSPVELEALRRVVREYWDAWRAMNALRAAHPAVRAALEGQPLCEALAALLAAWREERTSELARAVELVDEAARGPAPSRLEGPESCDAWIASWQRDPGSALAELARRAQEASWNESWTWDRAAMAERATLWRALARCAGALRECEPDPRVGRAVEAALESSADDWFRVDQVAHAVTAFAPPHDEPSFADHALALLERHADGGTAARLEDKAQRLLYEAACNEAEMSSRLRALSLVLRERYPRDRALPEPLAAALRARAP